MPFAIRCIAFVLLLAAPAAAAAQATPADQRIPPLPRRLTNVEARIYEPIHAPGEDPFGRPADDIDRTHLAHLVGVPAYDLLEAELRTLAEQTRADIRNEVRLASAYQAFARADETMTEWLDAWVTARPGSVEALLARAAHRTALAWKSRGDAFLARTTAAQREGMLEHARAAAADLRAAAELAPEHFMLFELSFGAVQFGGWSEQTEELLRRGLELYPLSGVLRERAIDVARPVWGGSWETMQDIADEAVTHAAEAPWLAVLQGAVAAERGRMEARENNLPAAVHYYTQALEHGPAPGFLIGRGAAWLAAHDYARALTDLLDASWQAPQDPHLLELRTHGLFEISEFAPPDIRDMVLDRAWEAAMLLRAVDPSYEHVDTLVAWIGDVREACRARAPNCRGRPGRAPHPYIH